MGSVFDAAGARGSALAPAPPSMRLAWAWGGSGKMPRGVFDSVTGPRVPGGSRRRRFIWPRRRHRRCSGGRPMRRGTRTDGVGA